MTIGAFAKPVTSLFSGRFFVVSVLPTSAAALYLLVLWKAGAPGPVEFGRAWSALGRTGAGGIVALVLLVAIAAKISEPFQLVVLRWLEGAWPHRLRRLTDWCVHRQRTKRGDVDARVPAGSTPEVVHRSGLNVVLAARRYPRPHEDHLLRPTALGNVLTATELRAGRPYGLDAVTVWPLLEPLLDDKVRAAVADRRDSMDALARLSVTSALLVPLSLWLLWRSGWWLLLAAGLVALSRLAYLAAVQAALAFGECVVSAVHLHHLDLPRALHLPLPPDIVAEVAQNRRLTRFLLQNGRLGLPYEHPAPATPDPAAPPTTPPAAPPAPAPVPPQAGEPGATAGW
ncbi:hypothetical protein [Kitasatospora sp. NPDC057500]|uniref:hypothetical protein n=1 Tax=Kitasatospora sp. NPDC057500 TaxID=3346151 RepID=UPI00368BD006